MKDAMLDVLAFLVIACLPAEAQAVLWPVQGVVKESLTWLLETAFIWARRVRQNLER